MDYKRLYKIFIADRRKREADLLASGEYCERHHIVPRSLGGRNENANVIRLTYRDHIFAHALLLKGAANDEERWYLAASMSAVLNLREGRQRASQDIARVEAKYGWARKLHGRSIVGKAHPNYNDEVVQLFHLDGRKVTGTRQDLIKETGLGFRAVYDLVNGERDIWSGWCASQHEIDCRIRCEKIRATRGTRTMFGYHHIDGRFVKATDLKEANKNGVDRSVRRKIRLVGFSDGWSDDPEEAKARAAGEWRRSTMRKMHTNAFDLFGDDIFDEFNSNFF